jgi:hypothetical protein
MCKILINFVFFNFDIVPKTLVLLWLLSTLIAQSEPLVLKCVGTCADGYAQFWTDVCQAGEAKNA